MSFCRFPQPNRSLLKPSQAAAVGSSQIVRIHLAEPEGGKAKHCNSEKQKHLSTAKDGFWFRSCINVFHEPENLHDGMMPSARSINGYALQAICVFPFRSCHWGLCVFSKTQSSWMWCLRHTNTHLCVFLTKGGIVHRLAVK